MGRAKGVIGYLGATRRHRSGRSRRGVHRDRLRSRARPESTRAALQTSLLRAASAANGSVKRNVVVAPGELSTEIIPPWASTRPFVM